MQSVSPMETATGEGNIESLNKIFKINLGFVEKIDSIPFVESRMHVAAL